MAIAMTEEMSASLQRGLSEWWSEETEYIFQRIERWAAFARGYNRLRSQRLSRGRLTMHEEQESRWSISSNKIVIEDPNWCPRFHNLRRSHRGKSRNDEDRHINCCGTFNYQSSSNLDSNCLENYRYDHSIYFKTIGDIKSSKTESVMCNDENHEISLSSDENIEWNTNKNSNELFDNFIDDEDNHVNGDFFKEPSDIPFHDFPINVPVVEETKDQETDRVLRNVWPIVDLNNLSLDINTDERNISNDSVSNNDDENNNFNEDNVNSTDKMIQLQINSLTANQTRFDSTTESTNDSTVTQKNYGGITRIMSVRKPRRSSRRVRQPAVVGDNNILWPGVLLNYTKNVDNNALSPHHYRAVQVK